MMMGSSLYWAATLAIGRTITATPSKAIEGTWSALAVVWDPCRRGLQKLNRTLHSALFPCRHFRVAGAWYEEFTFCIFFLCAF